MKRKGARRRSPRRATRRLRPLWRGVRQLLRRARRSFAQASTTSQALVLIVTLGCLWFALNAAYQVARKPSELFFPVSGTLNKPPAETWRSYSPLFRRYSTALIPPELLAALAQVEGAGNPLARTYWRWSLKPGPFDVYKPASSSVGMYQLNDGTFAIARHYCIRDHRVVADGAWSDWHSCWFNALYTRVIPSHAVQLTAAYLDVDMSALLERHHIARIPRDRARDLAALIHLCGAGAADGFVRRGLKIAEGERCGDHPARDYMARVEFYARIFGKLAQEDGG